MSDRQSTPLHDIAANVFGENSTCFVKNIFRVFQFYWCWSQKTH